MYCYLTNCYQFWKTNNQELSWCYIIIRWLLISKSEWNLEILNSLSHTVVPPSLLVGWQIKRGSYCSREYGVQWAVHSGATKANTRPIYREATHTTTQHSSTGRGQSLLNYASPTGIQELDALYKLGGNSTQGYPVTIFFCMSSNQCGADYYLQVVFLVQAIKASSLSSRATLLNSILLWGADSVDCQLILP